MSNWNLDALYSGYESIEFKNDFKSLQVQIDKINNFAANINEKLTEEDIVEIIELNSNFDLIARKLMIFVSLNSSSNTTDSTTVAHQTKLQNLASSIAKSMAIIEKAITKIDNLPILLSNKTIKEHEFYLNEIINSGKHMLSDDVEEAISLMRLNASNSFRDLQRFLTSTVKIEMNGKDYTLSSIRN